MRRSRPLAATLAAGLLATVMTWVDGATAAASTPSGSLDAYVEPIDAVSSTGQHLQLWLQAQHGAMDVFLSRGHLRHGLEVHDWMFTTPQAVLRYDRAAGTGRVDVSSELTHGFADIHLHLRKDGPWTAESCTSGSAHDAALAVRGTVVFWTHTAGRRPWGRVGRSASPLHVSASGHVRAFDNCVAEPEDPCRDGIMWQHEMFVAQQLPAENRLQRVFEGSRWHQRLAGRQHVQRLDEVVMRAPALTLDRRADGSATLHIDGAAGTRAHGHARLVSDSPPQVSRNRCGTTRNWTADRWRNGRHPFTIRMDVGRDITAPDGSGGFFRKATP
jgi:hypothetical protein